MKKIASLLIIICFLSGCSLIQSTWEENKQDILDKVVDALEDEKEKDRLIDELIDQLEERKASVAPINS